MAEKKGGLMKKVLGGREIFSSIMFLAFGITLSILLTACGGGGDGGGGGNTTVSLTVAKAGTGGGTITSSPAGINCGADCLESYSNNQAVTLTATADTGSTFTGWSGDCSGTSASATLTMSATKTCTATFNKIEDIISLFEDNGTGTENNINFYYIYSDGTGFKNIKNSVTAGSTLNMSTRNNNEILYSVEISDDNYNIYIYHVDTGTISTVVTGASGKTTSFSPDNSRVVFIKNGAIKKINPDVINAIEEDYISPDTGWEFGLLFIYSPDKTKILTHSFATGNLDQVKADIYDADGTNKTPIFGPRNSDMHNYSWNKDGTEVLYTYQDQTDFSDHAIINSAIDGSAVRDLSLILPREWYPWGPYNNLFSLSGKFYSPIDGSLVCSLVSPPPPVVTPTLFGFDKDGYIYYSDSDGSNLFKVGDCQ